MSISKKQNLCCFCMAFGSEFTKSDKTKISRAHTAANPSCTCMQQHYLVAPAFFVVRAKPPFMSGGNIHVSFHQVMSYKPQFALASTVGQPIPLRDIQLCCSYTDLLLRDGALSEYDFFANGPFATIPTFNLPCMLLILHQTIQLPPAL